MNSTEKRRQELLTQTRKLYNEKPRIPAVHPRFGSFGIESYEDETDVTPINSFRIRILLAVFLFMFFAGMDYAQVSVGDWDSSDIVSVVSQNVDVVEVWNSW